MPTWMEGLGNRVKRGEKPLVLLLPLGRRRADVSGPLWTRRAPGSGAGPGGECAHGATPRDLGGARLAAQRRADPPSLLSGDPCGPPRSGVLPHGAVVGRGMCVRPRRDRPGALLLHVPRHDVRLTLGPARGERTRGACRGTSEGKGHSWRGMSREEEGSANFLTLIRSRRWKRPFDFPHIDAPLST